MFVAIKKYENMRSLISYILPTTGKWTFKPGFLTAEALNAKITSDRKFSPYQAPKTILNDPFLSVSSTRSEAGNFVYTVSRKDEEVTANMLFIHGGAFVLRIMDVHWQAISWFVKNIKGLRITVPLYGLAPEVGIVQVHEEMIPLYQSLASDPLPFFCFGDSSGGALALSLTLQAISSNHNTAEKLILLSPLLDATFANPVYEERSASDPMLHINGMREAMRLACTSGTSAVDLRDLRISPFYGEVNGLPSTIIFTAENDLLTPDAEIWAEKARAGGVEIEVVRGEGMVHDWMLVDFKEGNDAKKRLVAWLGR